MTLEPLTFLRETFPSLFNKGFAQLEEASKTSDGAKRALEDVRGATGAVALHVEGAGEVYLKVDGGKMTRLDASPDPSTIRLAIAAPGAALAMLLGEAHSAGELDEARAAKRAVRTASKTLQDVLAKDSLLFHIVVEAVPDLGNVTVRIGLNASEPPATPGFSATLHFSDLEAAQAGETNLQQLFLGGKLRMAGDYSRALQIAMQLMQLAQQQR